MDSSSVMIIRGIVSLMEGGEKVWSVSSEGVGLIRDTTNKEWVRINDNK